MHSQRFDRFEDAGNTAVLDPTEVKALDLDQAIQPLNTSLGDPMGHTTKDRPAEPAKPGDPVGDPRPGDPVGAPQPGGPAPAGRPTPGDPMACQTQSR